VPIHFAAYAVVARKFVEADAARGERVEAKSHHIVGGQPAQLSVGDVGAYDGDGDGADRISFTTISIPSLSVP
jgi:hypothetical protein